MIRKIKRSIAATFALLGVAFVCVIGAVYIAVAFFPELPLVQQAQQLWRMSTEDDARVSNDTASAFRTALLSEVTDAGRFGDDAFVPSMFLEVFPGLTATDFEGVESRVGHYTVENGRLIHELDDTRLVHDTATAVADKGFSTLLINVSNRLGIDLSKDGTLTVIMDALIKGT
jgi:hypothetical protein